MSSVLSKTELRTESILHPDTWMGYVHYTVADLERQIAFYTDVLGFRLHEREAGTAILGSGEPLLSLTERPGARQVRRTTGLYHTAFLVPTRWDLAHLLRSIAETRTPIQGMVNHYTHLAIYLPDAEGNGIELAWDFPKEQWPSFEEMIRRGNGPLDTDALFAELERDPSPWTGLNPDTRVGHVHLHVADLDAATRFYHDVLGFDVKGALKEMGAAFLSAGGYHHHLGLNVWNGVGAPPPPPDATGLRYMTVVLPDAAELEKIVERIRKTGIEAEMTENGVLVRDPSHNGVLLINR